MKLYTKWVDNYRAASFVKKGLLAVAAAIGFAVAALTTLIVALLIIFEIFGPDTPPKATPTARAVRAPATAVAAPATAADPALKDEEIRHDAVKAGIAEGRAVTADQTRCETLKEVGDAWNQLKQVKRSDPEWQIAQKVAQGLEACRRKSEQTISKGMRSIMIQQREQWAQKAERGMLDGGMDVEFILSGPTKDRVTLKWVLMSKVAAHKFTDGGSMADGKFLPQLQNIGFRRVTFSDGYNKSWSYELEPADETKGGSTVLAQMGLEQPLVLR